VSLYGSLRTYFPRSIDFIALSIRSDSIIPALLRLEIRPSLSLAVIERGGESDLTDRMRREQVALRISACLSRFPYQNRTKPWVECNAIVFYNR